ncbi:Uncharacterised protein [Legionella beliardensis]|uniref:Uncharacterized protein n=1 Tax=Legionella beliardensis TaxID=91822 RepID=A0A378I3L7_9GAMM|nr:hypothetical protein [Legionella beliardensis]STX29777.1 Uncharacterised protein [Legionella beliardensis]
MKSKYLHDVFDAKEQLTNSILPIQGFFHAKKREYIHTREYPYTSFVKDIFIPKNIDRKLLLRILKNLDHVSFITYLNHITNQAYLDLMLDSAIYSRKFIEKNRMFFIGSALNSETEPADYDTVCFGIGDIDSTALKNGSLKYPPAKITVNFKKLLKARHCIEGQMFVKEHDLLWTTKPDNQEFRDTCTTAKDHAMFACYSIPEEFSKVLPIGNINLKIYRNACGVKFVLENEQYVLHYNYNGKYLEPYNGLSIEEKLHFNIQEEVIEKDFGQTLFYGPAKDTEKFFVMQFFRHIEKLPKLMKIIYAQLDAISDEEMIHLFNNIGKILSCGAEFNFHRGFCLPIEAISQVQFLKQFDVENKDRKFYSTHYGCNQFFSNPLFKPVTLDINDVINIVQSSDINLLISLIRDFQPVFKSARFIKYILNFTREETEQYNLLNSLFEEIVSNESRESLLQGKSPADIIEHFALIIGNREGGVKIVNL